MTGDHLTVNREGTGDGHPDRFLHRGIATRRFRRVFRSAPGLDVAAAGLDRSLPLIAVASGGADRVSRAVPVRPPST